jgi:hypothetical protein
MTTDRATGVPLLDDADGASDHDADGASDHDAVRAAVSPSSAP